MYRSTTSLLLRSLNEQTAIFASKNQFTHLCNMQSNVLNDLTKAKRRRTEKNRSSKTATGAMARYFDIALLPPHLATKEDPHPNRKPRKQNQQRDDPERSSRCTVLWTSHGSPMLAFLFLLGGVGEEDKPAMGLPRW